ncbi:hypothetical protein CSKR_109766 [Clonorchis sinensis]|uniref:Uncharacterized protein n=1 Tax=Clonorchis sinensis TaxID=79923 RepID=A0A3R7F547_CLOSI|nr:hypothetical protein CSKR_109766 [Clonorchis sinensis]
MLIINSRSMKCDRCFIKMVQRHRAIFGGNSLSTYYRLFNRGEKFSYASRLQKLNVHLLLERVFLNFPGYSLTVTQIQANASKRLHQFRNRSYFSRDAMRIYEKTHYSLASSVKVPFSESELQSIGARRSESEFTHRKVCGSNLTSASQLSVSRLGQPSSIPALVQPSGGMASLITRLVVIVARLPCLRTRLFSLPGGRLMATHFVGMTVLICGVNLNHGLNRSAVTPFRCLAAMPPEGSARAEILPVRMAIRNVLLIRLLKILRQPTTGFALLGAHQAGTVPEFPSTLCST